MELQSTARCAPKGVPCHSHLNRATSGPPPCTNASMISGRKVVSPEGAHTPPGPNSLSIVERTSSTSGGSALWAWQSTTLRRVEPLANLLSCSISAVLFPGPGTPGSLCAHRVD
eukprot:180303-Amphidinium_carterae.1